MAYVEVWKSGRLVARRRVDEQKAKTGCRIRLGATGEVRVAIGQSEKLGEFEVRMFEGEPPPIPETLKRTAAVLPPDDRNAPALAGKADAYPDIEGYRIIERLGEGGMGIVWRAEQLSTHRQVALKLMTPHGVMSQKAQVRFQREVELTARLDHPNIARIYESGLHRGMYYYAMELVVGEPLDRYVKSRRLSQVQILALVQMVCQAVLYAHLRAVIHRDLKPSNILVSADGQPHVLDFGLAKALLEEDEALNISIEGQITGTPSYMSPEQAAGRHSEIDTRTDVFSLGVILYELLLGQSPHDLSGPTLGVLRNIADGKIRRPREVNKSFGRELEALLLKALAHNPEDRYASAGTLAIDISNYLDGEPLDAPVPTKMYFVRKKAWKYRVHIAVVAAIMVSLLFAYTRAVEHRTRLKDAENEVRIQKRKAQLAEESTEWAELELMVLGKDEEQARAALRIIRDDYIAAQEKISKLQQELDQRVSASPTADIKPKSVLLSHGGFIFGQPANFGPTVNTSYQEEFPCISSDGLELYFGSDRPGGYGANDIWLVRRATTSDPWGEPVNLGPKVNTQASETPTSISSDGLELYFVDWITPRPGGYGNCDIWVARRVSKNGPWEEPVNLGPPISTSDNEGDASISADGLTLYFSRDARAGDGDLFVTTRATKQDRWGPPDNLGPTINSSSNDSHPCILPDNLALLFVSERPGGFGVYDIYITRRSSIDQNWSAPVNLGPTVNSSMEEWHPCISPDGSTLIFQSNRPGGVGGYDLWQVPIIPIKEPIAGFTFGKPTNLGPPVNTSSHEGFLCFSSDGLELYFGSPHPTGGYGNYDIWVATRATTNDPWGKPVNLGPKVNTQNSEVPTSISSDGLELYLIDWLPHRPGGYGGCDIWVARRSSRDAPWGEPVNLGPPVNTSDNEDDSSISADGLTLYFSSDARAGGDTLTSLFVTTRATKQGRWGPPVNLGPTVNSPGVDSQPCILADNLVLLFTSDRPGGLGGHDIYITRRSSTDQPWSKPVNLGPTVNSPVEDWHPRVWSDGSMLIFLSNRSGGRGNFDLWQVPIIPVQEQIAGFTFGKPTILGPPVSTSYHEVFPCISSDGLELYFGSDRPGGYGSADNRFGGYGSSDIWVARRATTSDLWGEPVNLGPKVNTQASETPTSISYDGLELYLIDWPTHRPGGYGSTDIWVARRAAKNDPWAEPVNLGPPVSTSDDEGDASISADGLTLYFHSDRRGSIGLSDLLVTTRATKQGRWGPPVNLGPTVNSSGVDSQPCILADNLVLLFTSGRAGGLGGYDIYVTRRSAIDQPWSKPVNLGPTVNSPVEDWHPCISPDGSTIIFQSDRPGGLGDFDLWQAQIIPNVDFNGDGTVDIKDLEILVEYWGQNEPSVDIAPRPFGNGVVDVKDLEVLMSYWGQKVQRPASSSP